VQFGNAVLYFLYDLVEMTDYILEAINSGRQAFISGLRGSLFPYTLPRLGYGFTQRVPLD
jgi:hypothetical protein